VVKNSNLKCFNCNTVMECVNDINESFVRIDWFLCPNCYSKGQVEYEIETTNRYKSIEWSK